MEELNGSYFRVGWNNDLFSKIPKNIYLFSVTLQVGKLQEWKYREETNTSLT